ncbi:DUF4372 domain-containing protein [Segatella buccae]|uniref:DUF4372 domain-containing protein n=1 Tax=Segatella buccae TaxID=28126 RepID=UPI003A5212AA
MMFGQLSNRESRRDIVVALEAHHSKCKFLGIESKPIAKTHFHLPIRIVTIGSSRILLST